jgi:hypothetical protein
MVVADTAPETVSNELRFGDSRHLAHALDAEDDKGV